MSQYIQPGIYKINEYPDQLNGFLNTIELKARKNTSGKFNKEFYIFYIPIHHHFTPENMEAIKNCGFIIDDSVDAYFNQEDITKLKIYMKLTE